MRNDLLVAYRFLTQNWVQVQASTMCGCCNILDGFTKRLRSVPPTLRKTLTFDQGTEMALHETFAKRLKMDIFFCDPRSPWQRASNENANGLIREFLPKGTDLSTVSAAELRAIEARLNGRPRQLLGQLAPDLFLVPGQWRTLHQRI